MKQALVSFAIFFMIWHFSNLQALAHDHDGNQRSSPTIFQNSEFDFNSPENRKSRSPFLCGFAASAELSISPTTRYLVLPVTKATGETSIQMFDTQLEQKIELAGNFKSIGWEGQEDILWLRRGRDLFTFDGKNLVPELMATRIYQRIEQKWRTRREGFTQGVLIFRSKNGRKITFFDLHSNKVTEITIPSAIFRAQVGRSQTTGKVLYFVSWSSIVPETPGKNFAPANIQMFRHLRVLDATGSIQIETKVGGRDVGFFPNLSKNGVFVLARYGDKKCLWSVDKQGKRTATAFSDCEKDIERVFLIRARKFLLLNK